MKSNIHRAIANARERDRTESINNAFNRLRTLLPTEPAERKLSKVEILRLATSYIRHLSNIKHARLKGSFEQNVCPRNNQDFCTFCITTSKITFANDWKNEDIPDNDLNLSLLNDDKIENFSLGTTVFEDNNIDSFSSSHTEYYSYIDESMNIVISTVPTEQDGLISWSV